LTAKHCAPYLLVCPILLLLGVILIAPELIALAYSFSRFTLGETPTFVGLGNYVQVLRDPSFWQSSRITVLFVLVTVSGQLLLGFAFALLMNREFVGKNLVLAIVISPFAISPAAAAVMWKTLLSTDFGLINFGLTGLGYQMADFPWLTEPALALVAIIIVDIWMFTPMVFILLYASMQGLPKEPFEAAAVDGASAWQRIRYLTIPMILPAILVTLIFRLIYALRSFAHIYVLTAGGPNRATDVLALYLYRHAFRYFDFGTASAVAWLMLVIAVLLTAGFLRQLHRTMHEVA
jgi:multiple sugar transport system permease protein